MRLKTASPKVRAKRTTMRAAVLVEPRRLAVREVPLPQPGPGQVRIRIEGCGVCASNIAPYEGREWFSYPFQPGQLGHEGWGFIDALAADVDGLDVGQRVTVLSQNAFAEFDIADAAMTIPLPNSLADVPLPGEPIGCAMNIFRRSGIAAGSWTAIIGIGFLGSLLTRLATIAGSRVIAISRRPFSLDMARKMGAAETIDMDDHWRIIEQVKRLTDGQMCPVTIEAVGKQWPLDLAGDLTGERGRLVVAGYHQDGLRQVNMQMWNWRGLDVINAHERDPLVYASGIRQGVQAVATGQIDPQPLFTHRFTLDRLDEAIQTTRDRPDGFMKALVMIE